MDTIKSAVRSVFRVVARVLNSLSGGRITPTMVTYVSLIAHLPVAWLIATYHNVWAAIFLVIFGLFDVLDGELARLQGSSTKNGMLLDSVTDRVKEIMLYIGVSYAIVYGERPRMVVWAVAALGASLLVSYLNAWGEAITAGEPKSHPINKAFRSGIMGFELRMTVLVLGLLSNRLVLACMVIAVLAALTAVQRFIKISHSLTHAQN